ncbi:thioredoxin-like protein [Thelonectria olida]|uniref:Thioredoxin-like protein n=1 Tax=Thelonectria olida TaxID=1576542 RepID=A0A9P8W1K4_9HYPO|nr:thioredoxin-like protein [Thelonectria olida]
MSASPNIIFYTDRQCPFAHRVYIALAELELPFKEQFVDINVPRTEEYLKVNPKGKIPSLSYNGEILVESGIIAKFLADAHPSHLIPPSDSEAGALRRARVDFFVTTYETNVLSLVHKLMFTPSTQEAQGIVSSMVENIVQEIEPLLVNAKPYFDGSDKVTLAEVLTASFVLRFISLVRHGILPPSTSNELATRAPHFTRWAQMIEETPNIAGIYEEMVWVNKFNEKIANARA